MGWFLSLKKSSPKVSPLNELYNFSKNSFSKLCTVPEIEAWHLWRFTCKQIEVIWPNKISWVYAMKLIQNDYFAWKSSNVIILVEKNWKVLSYTNWICTWTEIRYIPNIPFGKWAYQRQLFANFTKRLKFIGSLGNCGCNEKRTIKLMSCI